MKSTSPRRDDWAVANQRYLTTMLGAVRTALEAHGGAQPESATAGQDPAEIAASMPAPPALQNLVRLFQLSSFERDVLLLCAGTELEADFGPLCAKAQGDAQRNWPSFGLALAALPDAHWSALSPGSPLRQWRLVHTESGQALTRGMLCIDERVLHYLVGIDEIDRALMGLVRPMVAPEELVPSHEAIASEIGATWSAASRWSEMPAAQLCGRELDGKRAIAAALCRRFSWRAFLMPFAAVPADATDLDRLRRTWLREAALSNAVLVLDCDGIDRADRVRAAAIARFVEEGTGPLIVLGEERLGPWQRPVLAFDVEKPLPGEQRELWRVGLAGAAGPPNGVLDPIVAQFSLSSPVIAAACQNALGRLADERSGENPDARMLVSALWEVCRRQARPQLDDLAQRIEPAATRAEIVLPSDQGALLDEIVAQVRYRSRVYETWGFAGRGRRGLGITALFAGPSGTGKTMAAEVLAGELQLDLYRIDLSAVVSKYIGETEKNLRRVFDAAEAGGAILLFDEADALFGKRSDVKDSHDRHANIEVSYLLQRLESYRGLAILTSNLKDALDVAFLRRLRFVVSFPFPDETEREEIWRRVFPPETPTENLDVVKLARLNVAGGNIRNIAVNATFLAANEDRPVRMEHVLGAARREYAKLERPLTSAETKDW